MELCVSTSDGVSTFDGDRFATIVNVRKYAGALGSTEEETTHKRSRRDRTLEVMAAVSLLACSPPIRTVGVA